MNPEIDKLIDEQFKRLPMDLQSAINSVPWKSLVQEVGKANTLTSDQIASLEQEVMFVIYGFENPRDFVENIIKEVGVEEELAITLAEDVSIKVLREIESKVKTAGDGSKSNLPEIPLEDLPAVIPQPSPEAMAGKAGEKVHDTNKPVDSRQQIVDRKEGRVPENLPTDNNVPTLEKSVDSGSTPLTINNQYTVEEKPKEKTRPGGDGEEISNSQFSISNQASMPNNQFSNKDSEVKTPAPTNNAYPTGQDPYREPIE